MNETEKERLIKKDLASIENRVRHAFNQGYEMGLKENLSLCYRSGMTGQWIKIRMMDVGPDKICDDSGIYYWMCSICGSKASGWGNYKYCPKCGATMEVQE